MVNAVLFDITPEEKKFLLKNRYLKRRMMPESFSSWIGVDYLVLCQDGSASLVAKIEDIALSRADDGMLKFRLSEVRNVWLKSVENNESSALFAPARNGKDNPQLVVFDGDAFFKIGDPCPFTENPEFSWPMTLKRAAEHISATYGVDPNQVEITIRHQHSAEESS